MIYFISCEEAYINKPVPPRNHFQEITFHSYDLLVIRFSTAAALAMAAVTGICRAYGSKRLALTAISFHFVCYLFFSLVEPKIRSKEKLESENSQNYGTVKRYTIWWCCFYPCGPSIFSSFFFFRFVSSFLLGPGNNIYVILSTPPKCVACVHVCWMYVRCTYFRVYMCVYRENGPNANVAYIVDEKNETKEEESQIKKKRRGRTQGWKKKLRKETIKRLIYQLHDKFIYTR